ncbi:Formin-like protein 6 [Dendrobium catenatum]|uniref:Formin-like protein 6 n=1 Tax=Dendrobium catenatum TaxID=906689 RepID=A0A2I0VBI3_9ASPA|nr:Formin-like protein 6 [Dendrobium catenatum]
MASSQSNSSPSRPVSNDSQHSDRRESPSLLSSSGITSWAKNLKIPQAAVQEDPQTGNAGKSTFARFTSGLGLRLSPKSTQKDDNAEGSPTPTQQGVFGSLTKGFVDSSKNAVKAVQVKARHIVSQNKRRYQNAQDAIHVLFNSMFNLVLLDDVLRCLVKKEAYLALWEGKGQMLEYEIGFRFLSVDYENLVEKSQEGPWKIQPAAERTGLAGPERTGYNGLREKETGGRSQGAGGHSREEIDRFSLNQPKGRLEYTGGGQMPPPLSWPPTWGKYKVYNLCSERLYDASLLEGKVACFPFDDHNCPPIELVTLFCQSAYNWLKEDIENVVVVHCKAGMARTGLMISSLLLYLKFFPTAEESIEYYNQKRCIDGKGLVLPSQIRYVKYFERTLTYFNGENQPGRRCMLRGFRLHRCPYWIRPSITISNHNGILFSTKKHPRTKDLLPEDFWFSAPKKGIMVFALPGESGLTEVAGDFKINFHDRQGDFYWYGILMSVNYFIAF